MSPDWSIAFYLGILCIQLQTVFFLAHPATHSHIPTHMFMVDILSLSEDSLTYSAFMHVWKFYAGDNSANNNSAAVYGEIPRRCEAMYSPDPRTLEYSTSPPGPSPLGPTMCEGCKEGRVVIPKPASSKQAPENSLYATSRSFNKAVVKNNLPVQHKVHSY